ncbi:hypothetical protein J7T55_014171 [Diaporthe amygdali]|uniref:uncharacterized protein n=1 Tax=Phomopsis amygdali TaxID=1214568 RepID=UPI0022FF352F|nr:uncharacterized protein J7T55_014171 [Diaporthe amygdali]KAJ0109609.1 hypothetical protein J7T55_014171 [Diaporthe amygdali]
MRKYRHTLDLFKDICDEMVAPSLSGRSDLGLSEREDYINAVLCLQSLPSRHDSAKVPGAKSRFDDFVAVHIEMTFSVHGTASFLGWHRVYLWLYEKALRDECGYKGYQPYNNWARHASDPIKSPIFNGNATSLSGNGAKYPYDGVVVGFGPSGLIPADEGGGCDRLLLAQLPSMYQPILKLTVWAITLDVSDGTEIGSFQNKMQGVGLQNDWGVHTAGHYTIGGDPAGDFFVSPGDPAFYLHHGMIDRVWWIWQNQDLPARLRQISGGTTMGNFPPSKNGTLDDDLEYGVLGDKLKLGNALDTLAGPFCYVYV